MFFIHKSDKVIVGSSSVVDEVEGNRRLRIAPHIDIEVDQLVISFDGGRTAAENGTVDQWIQFAGSVEYQHILCLDIHVEADIFEVVMVDAHVDGTRIAELVVNRQVAHIYGTGIHVDGVGECIIRIGIFDTQAAVQHVCVALYGQRFERAVQVDVSESPSFHVFGHLFHKRMEESQVDIVGIEEQGESGILSDREDIAAYVGPCRIVFIDAAQHQDTFLGIVPLAEQI